MTDIKDIESIIKDMIRNDEEIVTNYDSRLLCNDYKNTQNRLRELCKRKSDLLILLEDSMNDFFKLKQNPLLKKFRINSFKLVPTLTGFEYMFFLPRTVDKTSRQYFCYISMMDRLTREYDSISKSKDSYVILDITKSLNLDKLIGDE